MQKQLWVIGVRNAFRGIKSKYVRCKKLAVHPVHPHMGDLPKERVEGKVYPFKKTGEDYFGLFEVTVLRRPVKHWCCLFTSLITRTAHIEVVNGLDTDACMMVVTRFMARLGRPHRVIINKGTNFVGAAREFKECFDQWDRDVMCEQLARDQNIWKFNPPGVPHFGGNWEGLVRSCKKAMFAILGNRRLTLPVLTTAMCLVEQTLNARALTPVSDDPEVLEALTPNHFVLGQPVLVEPLMPDAARYVDCRKKYKVAQTYNQMIWADGGESIFQSGMCDLNGLLTTNVCSKLEIWCGWSTNQFDNMRPRWLVWLKCFLESMTSFDQHQSRLQIESFRDLL